MPAQLSFGLCRLLSLIYRNSQLQLMEDGLTVFKGADIAEDLPKNVAGFKAVLSHPVRAVGIGSDGDDLTAQLLKPPEVVRCGQESAAAVLAAGVQFQTLSLPGKGAVQI